MKKKIRNNEKKKELEKVTYKNTQHKHTWRGDTCLPVLVLILTDEGAGGAVAEAVAHGGGDGVSVGAVTVVVGAHEEHADGGVVVRHHHLTVAWRT